MRMAKQHGKREEAGLYNRFSWLKNHPEDLPIDEENQKSRKRGFDIDGFRGLIAAICLRACIDYKKATEGKTVDCKKPERTIADCHKFFDGDMFQFFVNRIPVSEIERMIRSTPSGAIHWVWRKNEDKEL